MSAMMRTAAMILVVVIAIGGVATLAGCAPDDGAPAGVAPLPAPDGVAAAPQTPTNAPVDNSTALGAGPAKVVINCVLPAGYKFNDNAPGAVVLSVDGKVVRFNDGNLSRRFDTPSFPLEVPVEISAGEGMVSADMRLYYCREGEEAACFSAKAIVESPVRVTPDGQAHTLNLVYEVKR